MSEELAASKADVLAGFGSIVSALDIAALQLDQAPCMQLDLSKVKVAVEKITAELEGEHTSKLPTLLGDFGHALGAFNANNSHQFRNNKIMTVVEETKKSISRGLK